MLAGLKYLVRQNLEDVVEQSYLNCHVKGVHSFMLNDCPGKSIRVFYATQDHVLWKNHDVAISGKVDGNKMSIGFHAHRRNIMLEVISGKLINVNAVEQDPCYGGVKLTEFGYESFIVDGKMKFVKKRENVNLTLNDTKSLYAGNSIQLIPEQLHTVVVGQGQTCAWFVYEGIENGDYDDRCFSNDDLEALDGTGLYIKPTFDQVSNFLAHLNLY